MTLILPPSSLDLKYHEAITIRSVFRGLSTSSISCMTPCSNSYTVVHQLPSKHPTKSQFSFTGLIHYYLFTCYSEHELPGVAYSMPLSLIAACWYDEAGYFCLQRVGKLQLLFRPLALYASTDSIHVAWNCDRKTYFSMAIKHANSAYMSLSHKWNDQLIRAKMIHSDRQGSCSVWEEMDLAIPQHTNSPLVAHWQLINNNLVFTAVQQTTFPVAHKFKHHKVIVIPNSSAKSNAHSGSLP